MPDKRSQEARILDLLSRARGAWVPAPQLAAISLQYSARVFSLRRKTRFRIENKVEVVNGIRHGFFRLLYGSPAQAAPASKPAATGALFDSGELARCAIAPSLSEPMSRDERQRMRRRSG